jgi:hypothetical protein
VPVTRRVRQTDDALADRALERRIIRDVLLHGMGSRYADCTLSTAAWSHPVYAAIWRVAAALDADGETVNPVTVSTRAQHPDLTLGALGQLAAGHDPRLDAGAIAAAVARLEELAAARRVVARLDATRQQILTHPAAADDAVAHLAAQHAETRTMARLLRLVDMEDVGTDDALVGGLILPDSLVVPWGPSGAGKSTVVHDLFMALATGGMWCGRQCRRVPVAILAYEGRWGLRRRLDAAAAARGVRDLRDLEVYIVDSPPSLTDAAGLRAVRRDIDRAGVGAVLVDTLTDACAGALDLDSGAGGDAARAVAALRSLQPVGGATVAIHHCGHDASRMRGAYALLASADTELHIADGIVSTRKQRDLPSDLRVSYSVVPMDGTVIAGYGGAVAPPRDDVRERVCAYLAAHPDASASAVWRAVGGNRGRILSVVADVRRETGTAGTGTGAVPAVPGAPEVPGTTGTHPIGVVPGTGTGTDTPTTRRARRAS